MDLLEGEDEVVKKQLRISEVKATFVDLDRYAAKRDFALIAISTVCAIIAGASRTLPIYKHSSLSPCTSSNELFQIVFSQIAYIFAQIGNTGTRQTDSASIINHYTLYFVYIATGPFVTQYGARAGFVYT